MEILEDLKLVIPNIDLLNVRLLWGGDKAPVQNPVEGEVNEGSFQVGDDNKRKPRNSSGHNSEGFFDASAMGNSGFPVKKTPQAGNACVFEWTLL